MTGTTATHPVGSASTGFTPAPLPAPPVGDRAGLVARETFGGPVFRGDRVRMRTVSPRTFVPLLEPPGRFLIALITVAWFACLVSFWSWLLRPEHRITTAGLVVNGLVLAYISLFPGYFLFAVNRLRGVNPDLEIPPLRVAFVVTKAPSEPWPVARVTLRAMLNQRYPHGYHVWLCDEDPSRETLNWCAERGVGVSSRRGAGGYHNTRWPRRTRCKEGNLAFFYDQGGYRDYDVVVQLDCDHVPASGYLGEMVRPFADPAIGYVAAPSVCDANARDSWSASGRLHAEASFHGALQMGHNGIAPLCIGSHYAVRTVALEEIGGIGPELAEDFSTTFLLTSAGWQGAFAHRAEAHGDGPLTMSAMLKQEFQWSRSLFTVLLETAPKHLRRMPFRLRARFLFALLYYPLASIVMVTGLILSPIAAVTGAPWLNINYFEFLGRWITLSCCLLLVQMVLRRNGLLRPLRPPLFSWRNALFVVVRWPYALRGTIAAIRQRISPRDVQFAVTPKTVAGFEKLPVAVVLPYPVISLVCGLSALYGEMRTDAAGYVWLCTISATAYAVVTVAVSLLHARETSIQVGSDLGTALRQTARVPLGLGTAALAVALTAAAAYPGYLIEVLHR